MSRNKCESDSDIAGATKKRSRTQEMAGESSLSEVALLAFEAQGPECRMVHEGCSSHLEFNPVLLHHLWWGKKELLPRYLEKAMAPHSSTLAWKIPWTEEPGRLQSMGSLRVRHDWATSLSLFTSHFHGNPWNGNPLQCSCLEHPRDGGAWWAAVYGVTHIWTRLKRRSSSSNSSTQTLLGHFFQEGERVNS